MCNSQLFLTHVLFTTKYLQLIFHSTKTQWGLSIAIPILWKKNKGSKMFKAKWLSTDILEEDSTILSQSCKPGKNWTSDLSLEWKSVKQMMEDNSRWKECVPYFFSVYLLWYHHSLLVHLWTRSEQTPWCSHIHLHRLKKKKKKEEIL